MSFNSPLFLFLFLPFFFAVYFAAEKKVRRIVGLLGSLIFFSWGNLAYIPLMLGIILWNFAFGKKLGTWAKEERSKKLLWLGIAGNLLVLVLFKLFATYGADWLTKIGVALSKEQRDSFSQIGFPLGLSYIVFQTISYLVDVFKGSLKSSANLLELALYVMLFPKIIVGPITRYKAVADQISAPVPTKDDVAEGIRRFIRGFAKKILIADMLAPLVNAAFKLGPNSIQSQIAWLALIAYALQIYFDFTGYTDMALGLGRMMGFQLGENFNDPYISQSVGEFWRRWHISLSTWFRDYVFFPLERRRLKYIGQPLNILIVFLLTGLWHGITTTFIFWGLLHGIFLVAENLFLGAWLRKTYRPLRHIYTLAAILLTWLFFRSPSLGFARDYLARLFGLLEVYIQPTFDNSKPLPFVEPSFVIAFVAGIVFSVPVLPWIDQSVREKSAQYPHFELLVQMLQDSILLILFVASLAFMASSSFTPGIYGSF